MAKNTAGIGSKVNPERSANLKASNAEYALISILFRHQDKIPAAAKELPPEQFVTDFGRRIYTQFIELHESGQEVSVSLLTPHFSETEISEIVKIINSDDSVGAGDFNTLIDVIRSAHFTPKPQEAAKLTSDELLKQMSILRKKKS